MTDPGVAAGTENSTRRRRVRIALFVAALVVVRLVFVAVQLSTGVEQEGSILGGDARRYEEIVAAEGTPYEDHAVEYPPLTLGLIWVVAMPDTHLTLTVLAATQLVLELAVALVLRWAWNTRTAIVYLVLGTPMALFPFPYFRTDLLSVFLAVAAVALLRRRADTGSGVALALAVFAKLWPVVLAPLFVLQRRPRAALACVAAGVVGLLAWVAWAGTAGIEQVVTFRGATGWQVESIPGILLHMADPAASTVQGGAWRTAVAVQPGARIALTVMAFATVALAWWLLWRRTRHSDEPTRWLAGADGYAPLAAVLGLLVWSSIISPQYMLWIVPFAAVVAARGDRTVGALTLAAVALSTYGLATIHDQIEGDLHATLAIVARNLVLVAMLGLALIRLARGGQAEGEAIDTGNAGDRLDRQVTASPSA